MTRPPARFTEVDQQERWVREAELFTNLKTRSHTLNHITSCKSKIIHKFEEKINKRGFQDKRTTPSYSGRR